jgi:thiamine-monophosphate kinase
VKKKKTSGEIERLQLIQSLFSLDTLKIQRKGITPRLVVSVKDLDDCAVYNFKDFSLVVTADFIRGTGFNMFRMGLMNYYDVGYYLVIANLSDIASMGAIPIGVTSVVRYTKEITDVQFMSILKGIHGAASKYFVPVIGGDIGGYEDCVLSATALGVTEKGNYLLRSGARKNDLLCVTGYIGLPETALTYFKVAKPNGMRLNKNDESVLIRSWTRPVARIEEGCILTHSGVGNGCQDVSDGLKQTVEQMSEASGVNFIVYEEGLPIHPITKRVASYLNIDPTHLAMSNSVDFQLLFTINSRNLSKCKRAFLRKKKSFTVIGQATNKTENRLKRRDGSLVPLPGFVWNQNFGDVTSQILNSSNVKETDSKKVNRQ